MVPQHRLFRKLPTVLGLFGLLLVLPGCPFSPDGGTSNKQDTRFTAERNSIEGTIDWVAQAWTQKRLPEYEQVLHTDFEFFIRDDDAEQFPWVPDGSWGRTEELDIARNMFNENFSGEERPVDTIEFNYTITNTRNITDAQGQVIAVEVRCDADVKVLVASDTGWLSDTRFEFTVVEDPDEPGLYQIIEQREKALR